MRADILRLLVPKKKKRFPLHPDPFRARILPSYAFSLRSGTQRPSIILAAQMHKTRHQKRNQVSIPRSGPNPHGARLCARIKRRPTANEQLLIVQVPIFVDPEISRANGNPSVTPFHVCASRSCEKNIDPLQVCSPSRPTCTKLILLDIPFKGGGRGGEGGSIIRIGEQQSKFEKLLYRTFHNVPLLIIIILVDDGIEMNDVPSRFPLRIKFSTR